MKVFEIQAMLFGIPEANSIIFCLAGDGEFSPLAADCGDVLFFLSPITSRKFFFIEFHDFPPILK